MYNSVRLRPFTEIFGPGQRVAEFWQDAVDSELLLAKGLTIAQRICLCT